MGAATINRERRIKSKCLSWQGEAIGRPRCQGRVLFAFIGANRESLEGRCGRSRRRFSAGRANGR